MRATSSQPATGRTPALAGGALQSASVEWQPAVEANGWELMLHFVKLGIGVAIVNACCRIPPGVSVRPLPELPSVQFHLFHAKKPLSKPTAELKAALLRHADTWKSGSGR